MFSNSQQRTGANVEGGGGDGTSFSTEYLISTLRERKLKEESVEGYRDRIREAFLPENKLLPEGAEMEEVSKWLTSLEVLWDLHPHTIFRTKVDTVLKDIVKLNVVFPKGDEHKLRSRLVDLLEKYASITKAFESNHELRKAWEAEENVQEELRMAKARNSVLSEQLQRALEAARTAQSTDNVVKELERTNQCLSEEKRALATKNADLQRNYDMAIPVLNAMRDALPSLATLEGALPQLLDIKRTYQSNAAGLPDTSQLEAYEEVPSIIHGCNLAEQSEKSFEIRVEGKRTIFAFEGGKTKTTFDRSCRNVANFAEFVIDLTGFSEFWAFKNGKESHLPALWDDVRTLPNITGPKSIAVSFKKGPGYDATGKKRRTSVPVFPGSEANKKRRYSYM